MRDTLVYTGIVIQTDQNNPPFYLPSRSVGESILRTEIVRSLVPAGVMLEFGGATAPDGYLMCDGRAYSRTLYASLFAAIGTAWGAGDGVTTFNVPDRRGNGPRGVVGIPNVTGTGSASSNNATFANHGYHRSGIKVRLASGTLTGLSTNTDYYTIYIDDNTLAFATSITNALAGTKIAISGVNTAVIRQALDPDASSRTAMNAGGNSGDAVGSYQEDALQGHFHDNNLDQAVEIDGGGVRDQNPGAGSDRTVVVQGPITDGVSGTPRTSIETRGSNVNVNYIIKT